MIRERDRFMKQYDIHVESIKDQIYRILKQEIIDCTLKSGEKLVEQTIAARFNVSRAPVREAIKQLTGDGLVINITNRGAFVKVHTAKEMEDMQEVRTIFEEHAVHHAVTVLTDKHRQTLQKLREAILCTIRDDDYRHYQELERELSIQLIRLCDNSIIEDTYTKAYTMMNNFSDSLRRGEHISLQGAAEERIAFIDALLEGDLQKALQLVREHAQRASQFIRQYVIR